MWPQVGLPFEQEFLETLAEHYGAGVNEVDYEAESDGARQWIKKWIADETRDRIRAFSIFPDGAPIDRQRSHCEPTSSVKYGRLGPVD